MKKKVIFILILLCVVIGICAFLNREAFLEKKEIQDKREIFVKVNGEIFTVLSIDKISDLGEETFSANLKSSGKDPVKKQYTGIPIKNIFAKLEIPIEGKKTVLVKGIDGYTVALTINEVLQNENVYLVYKEDGDWMKLRQEGGRGPYQMIIRQAPHSQRWCKYVSEIELQ